MISVRITTQSILVFDSNRRNDDIAICVDTSITMRDRTALKMPQVLNSSRICLCFLFGVQIQDIDSSDILSLKCVASIPIIAPLVGHGVIAPALHVFPRKIGDLCPQIGIKRFESETGAPKPF
jgi:hypothetical protein